MRTKERVRGRVLFGYLILSVVVAATTVTLLWPSWSEDTPPPLPEAVFALSWYLLLFGFLLRVLTKSRTTLRTLLGGWPTAIGWGLATGAALVGISFSTLFAVYVPLSYAWPGLVQWWLLDDPPVLIWTEGPSYLLANVINVGVIVLVGPFVRENSLSWARSMNRRWPNSRIPGGMG